MTTTKRKALVAYAVVDGDYLWSYNTTREAAKASADRYRRTHPLFPRCRIVKLVESLQRGKR